MFQVQILLLSAGWNEQGKETALTYLIPKLSPIHYPEKCSCSTLHPLDLHWLKFKGLEDLQTAPTLHWSYILLLSLVPVFTFFLFIFSLFSSLFLKSYPIFFIFQGFLKISCLLMELFAFQHYYRFAFLKSVLLFPGDLDGKRKLSNLHLPASIKHLNLLFTRCAEHCGKGMPSVSWIDLF